MKLIMMTKAISSAVAILMLMEKYGCIYSVNLSLLVDLIANCVL